MAKTESVPCVRRIEICGGIASGKTTLAQLVGQTSMVTVFEDFRSNPFWKSFYADPAGTAFETEISFLLQHYHEIKMGTAKGGSLVCDFSPLLDLAYAHVTLSGSKQAAFIAVHNEVRKELAPPQLLIHLICDPVIELDRIRRRGRDVEKSITIEYLQAINQAIDELVKKARDSWRVLIIDSGAVNFADDEQAKIDVLTTIQAELDTA